MTLDQLNERARAVAEHAPPEARAAWLHWNSTLVTILGDLLAGQRAQTASINSLRNELTSIVYSAIREYSAGVDNERVAVLEDIASLKLAAAHGASDRRVMLSLLGAIAVHLGLELDPQSLHSVDQSTSPAP
jgi:hypothetical protein